MARLESRIASLEKKERGNKPFRIACQYAGESKAEALERSGFPRDSVNVVIRKFDLARPAKATRSEGAA